MESVHENSVDPLCIWIQQQLILFSLKAGPHNRGNESVLNQTHIVSYNEGKEKKYDIEYNRDKGSELCSYHM